MQVRVIYPYPESLPAVYANNLVIHHSPLEFLVSFYQVFPPPNLENDPQDIKRKIEKTGGVPAHCVARIAIPKEQMPAIVEAFLSNLKKYQDREAQAATNNENGQGE